MLWQDAALMVIQFAFIPTLIPMIRRKTVVPKSTSVSEVVLLAALGVVYGTLHLWLGMSGVITVGVVWALIGRNK